MKPVAHILPAQHAIVAALLVGLIAVSAIAQAPDNGPPKEPLPTVTAGELPLYPRLAVTAAIEGTVRLRVSTDGEKATDVTVEEGQPMLAKAAQENLKSWRFAKHRPTSFETTFVFHLATETDCLNENDRVTLTLPARVDITATGAARRSACYLESELDLSEPLRVFLTSCEVDGSAVPCDVFTLQLLGGSRTISPKRFKDAAGTQGFFVPPELRELDEFGIVVGTPKGTFSILRNHRSFLKGKWRLVIDHAPFQEEWRYLTRKKQRCLGLVNFEWGEPEILASTPSCE
jgi:hypothetical protein